MPHFKLTHFDTVWNTLSDPRNAGRAEAYRVHFGHLPLPSDPRDAAVAQLNFLLDGRSATRVERDDVVIRGTTWHVQLRDVRAAKELQSLAREVVETNAPKVSQELLPQRIFRKAVDAVARRTGGGEPPVRTGVPRPFIQQGSPYDPDAPIPGDLAQSGTQFHGARPYALQDPAAAAPGLHYTQVSGAASTGTAAPARGATGLAP